ncbi:hypothetical protein [Microbacterium gorillae]|uniref:hypothetical protein n=1 Tax=Microbacterium gorillae TaxID=1231063 RepID=UPI003D963011
MAFRNWFRRSRSAQDEKSPTAREVLRESDRYEAQLLQAARQSGFAGIIGWASMGLLILVSWIQGSENSIDFTWISADSAGAALLALLPISLGLQVLVRMPRDPEALRPAQLIAQRQFWGSIASLVGAGAVFVGMNAISSALQGLGGGHPATLVDLLGVPIGALITLVLAVDASAIADIDAQRFDLYRERRAQQILLARLQRARIRGRHREHPMRALWWQGCSVAGVAVSILSVAAGYAADQFATGLLYAIAATFVVIAFFGSSPDLGRAIVSLKALDVLSLLVLPMLLSVFLGATVAVGAVQSAPNAISQALLVGLAVPLPAIIAVLSVAIPRPDHRYTAPLLDVAWVKLGETVKRLEEWNDAPRQRVPWISFAWSAALLAPFAVVSVPLAVAAGIARRHARKAQPRGPLITAWVLVIACVLAEVVLCVLVPIIWSGQGWW